MKTTEHACEYGYLIPPSMADDEPMWSSVWRNAVAAAGYTPTGYPEVFVMEPARIIVDGEPRQVEPGATRQFVVRGKVRPAD
jgi:hypothetical protein